MQLGQTVVCLLGLCKENHIILALLCVSEGQSSGGGREDNLFTVNGRDVGDTSETRVDHFLK